MSLLGKILLFFNLLAAGAFAYFATQDLKGRQTTTAAGLRHLLLIKGFPIDGEDNFDEEGGVKFKYEMSGNVPTTHVSKKLLEAYFGPGPGVVTSQLAEVKRVRAAVESAIGGAPDKASATRGYLLLLAETYEERLAIQTAGEDDLARRLAQKFDAVLKPAVKPDVSSLAAEPEEKTAASFDARLKAVDDIRRNASGDDTQRLERIAHLLVHIDRDPAAQKRTMMIVGMRRYVVAIAQQAVRFSEMAARVKKEIEADDVRFIAEYALLRDQSIKNTQMVNDTAANRRRLEEQLTKDQGFVTQRQTQLDNLKQALARVKADVDELIANQTKIEAVLFEVQREVGLTLDEVYKLEAELEKKERERFKP